MPHRFSLSSLLAVLILAPLLAGCAPGPQGRVAAPQLTAASSPRQSLSKDWPRDDLGREVALKGVPRRIVTLGPGATETVFALGAGPRLIGRDSGSDYPAQALQVPVVADYTGLFLESVVAARPDFIIVQGETWGKARVEEWQRQCDVPVALLSANTVAGVARGIEKVGAWLDRRGDAHRVAARLASSRSRIDGELGRAFLEVQRSPLWTAGRNTLIDDVMHHAGLGNTASGITGYKPFSLEVLLAKPPDFYIVTSKRRDASRVLRELRAETRLKSLECIREGRVIVVPADLVLRPSPRLAAGIDALFQGAQSHDCPLGAIGGVASDHKDTAKAPTKLRRSIYVRYCRVYRK
jgi:iron complex transport system substrate-binding protein